MRYLCAWIEQYGAGRVLRDDYGCRIGKISAALLPSGDGSSVLHIMFESVVSGAPEVTETYKVVPL